MKSAKVQESQNVEWKAVWHDDCLKWVCGFANAQGGLLVVGKNDKGKVVGVQNAKKLMEDLPNKIRSTMGVVVDVNLKSENALDMIDIRVPAYPNAISYHGKYYFRSGSTNQELSGYALDELLLRKYGRTYDSMPLPNIKISDFWHDAFDIFKKKSVASKRLTAEDVAVSDEELLHSLKLIENDRLLLAAALVFHQTPERWCLGASVKIGRFKDDAQILYQDEISGAVVGMADKVVETIFTKYFIGRIRYEGLQRIDDYPMPREALREAVMNALVHRDYSTGSPIQIRVYDNRVTIANACRLPEGTTWESLSSAHTSLPHNPLVAGAMFRSGQIEAWGRGIERIINACVVDKLPAPSFVITPRSFTICFHVRRMEDTAENGPGNDGMETIDGARKNALKSSQNSTESGLRTGTKTGTKTGMKAGMKTSMKIIELLRETPDISISAIANTLMLARNAIIEQIAKLKAQGRIRRIGPDKGGHWEVVEAPDGERL